MDYLVVCGDLRQCNEFNINFNLNKIGELTLDMETIELELETYDLCEFKRKSLLTMKID